MHVGYDHWLIIDSCIDKVTRYPAPLNYLTQIKVDPKTAVKKIIASHWHDDHIRGLSQIIDACESADLFCSGALSRKEFKQLIALYSNRPMMIDTGIKEFCNIINSLKKQNKKIEYVLQNKRLWIKNFNNSSHKCEVYSLSPPSESLIAAYLDFAIPKKAESKKRLIASSPNKNSVAIWISIGKFNILLGADLEETGQGDRGWSAIINSDAKPQGKASFYKIPHHGSKNAHHSSVWSEMLIKQPIAVLTPFQNKIPTQNDIKRLCLLSNNVYSTARIKANNRPKRASTVEKTIRETVNKITSNTSSGQVRLRLSLTGATKIDLFGDAFKLSCN